MNPYLINFSNFKVNSQLFFTLMGFIVFVYLVNTLGKKSRLRLQFFLDNMIYILIIAVFFGRLFTIVSNYQVYFYELSWSSIYKAIAIWQDKDISVLGMVFGLFIGLKRQTYLYQELFARWADVFAIASLGLLSLNNIGAFLYGNHYGRITESIFGVTFNSPVVKYTTSVYPTQLFATFYTMAIGIYCYHLYNKYRTRYDGYIFLQASFLFFTLRTVESFFRGDDTIYIWVLRMPGILSAILAYIFFHQIIKYEKKNRIS
jgi:prolipoprotein diacylglyceryltransferase